MTVDDNSSIYVGGLPYDISDDALRRVFYIYGSIIAIKIINDRAVGGKCYGFVTFANQRSAVQAIKEMDGKTINGRIVKVNEVKTRGVRPNLNRDNSRYDMDRGRDRGRGDNYDRHYQQEEYKERSQDYDLKRERGHDRTRDRYVDEERLRDYDRDVDDVELENERKRKRDWRRGGENNNEQQKKTPYNNNGDQDKQHQVHSQRRSRFDDHGSRDLESYNDDQDQGESNLEVSNQKLEELRKEICHMEELVSDKQEDVSNLQEKNQKLEDSLNAAKKLTSRRRIQLTKLHKCYLQMRDYDERSKKSEQELQWLIESTTIELGNESGGDGNGRV